MTGAFFNPLPSGGIYVHAIAKLDTFQNGTLISLL